MDATAVFPAHVKNGDGQSTSGAMIARAVACLPGLHAGVFEPELASPFWKHESPPDAHEKTTSGGTRYPVPPASTTIFATLSRYPRFVITAVAVALTPMLYPAPPSAMVTVSIAPCASTVAVSLAQHPPPPSIVINGGVWYPRPPEMISTDVISSPAVADAAPGPYASISKIAPAPTEPSSVPGGYCAAAAAGPNTGVTQTISVEETYRARPPGSPTTCEMSSSTYDAAPAALFTPPNLHFKYFEGKKSVPVMVTSVFPMNGPRAGHTENWFVLMFVTVGLLSSYFHLLESPAQKNNQTRTRP
eukprot:20873-Pelagococcus_subviridis.AAC.7